MIIHFIDLDDTLFDSGLPLTFIHKKYPDKALVSIPRDEWSSMQAQRGKYTHPVSYNGSKIWISTELLQQLRRAHPHVKPSELGVTDRFSRGHINAERVSALVKQFAFLKGRPDKVVFFTSKNKEAYRAHLLRLREEFTTTLGVGIIMVYYLNEFDSFSSKNERQTDREERLLLEYLIGKKVRRGQFVAEPQVSCEQAYYYASDRAKIEAVKRLQPLFDQFIERTPTSLYEAIYERMKAAPLTFSTHLITGNELNPFLNQKTPLLASRRIRAFTQFQTGEPGAATT